jgi:hypothetical protein
MVWSFECIVLFASAAPVIAMLIGADRKFDRGGRVKRNALS